LGFSVSFFPSSIHFLSGYTGDMTRCQILGDAISSMPTISYITVALGRFTLNVCPLLRGGNPDKSINPIKDG
jgi:hypothetical protein